MYHPFWKLLLNMCATYILSKYIVCSEENLVVLHRRKDKCKNRQNEKRFSKFEAELNRSKECFKNTHIFFGL